MIEKFFVLEVKVSNTEGISFSFWFLKSYQVESNRIESNQIKSNQIKSKQNKTNQNINKTKHNDYTTNHTLQKRVIIW